MTSPPDRISSSDPADFGFMLPADVPTPAFVIIEDAVRRNLAATVAACGTPARFLPHVKTHRAPWLTKWLVAEGVTGCKVATPAEAKLALDAGMRMVLWAFPTVNPANIARFVANARDYPAAQLVALVDSAAGIDAWQAVLGQDRPVNLAFRVDLDPGMGRTGVAIGSPALDLARCLHRSGCFAGWHLYDGHIKDLDRDARQRKVDALVEGTEHLRRQLEAEGVTSDLVAGTSYTLDLWPADAAAFVSSGSWTYSSDQHDRELASAGWMPAAFVLATVISTRNGTATLDAGAKAVAPDKPIAERFRWEGKILLMNEEHSIVESVTLAVGDRVLLIPRHTCTTAYLYDEALVLTAGGVWEWRAQLGCRR
ncbi:MAG TPA: alanine racemase [Acidocella sp.]|jgi:D-serine deaminase-like pyridoxal phosphate-dependent protein|nr:alanine racemase [Acidocella sp.]